MTRQTFKPLPPQPLHPQPVGPAPLTGRHVLLVLLSFFGVMLAVNGIFIYFALSTFNGTASDNAYIEGLHYNERIAAAEAQARYGITHRTTFDGHTGLGVVLVHKDDRPAAGLVVAAAISRPSTSRDSLALTFTERAPGSYHAAPALQPGAWIFELTVRQSTSGTVLYQAKEKLWLKP